MALSEGMKCAKFLLFSFNFLFFLAGVVLVTCGILVQTQFNTYFEFFGGKVNPPAIILIVVGIVILLIGFLGCCGAIYENRCMITTFAIFLGIVILLEIVAAVMAFYMRAQVEDFLSKEMIKAMDNYDKPGSEGVTKTWDNIQKEFKCCGVNGTSDWTENKYLPDGSTPDSCCKEIEPKCGRDMAYHPQEDTVYMEGCLPAFNDWVRRHIAIVGGVAIAIALLQIIGIIVSCCFSDGLQKRYEVV